MIQRYALMLIVIASMLISNQSNAESATESKFQELFITAGYSTAFGAALAAASLSFRDEPKEHLNDIAIGASVGFIAGSILGTFLAVTDKSSASHEPMSGWQLASIRVDPLIRLPHQARSSSAQLGLSFSLLVP
jgi:hypothetical protein